MAHVNSGAMVFSTEEPVKVLITGAAGQIAYSLVFLIARGDMFGPTRRVVLHLYDLASSMDKLEALAMELEDTAAPLLAGVVATSDAAVAFAGVDVALLVGARPRGPSMERKDLLDANAPVFREAGAALEAHAKRSVKVCVVGNPANTNALIAACAAPSLPRTSFTSLSRLDVNRATAMLARRVGANPGDVRGVVVWGNHSALQFPDARFAMREGFPRPHDSASVPALVADAEWLCSGFVAAVQQRGSAVIAKRGASSAASAASAIVDHMRDWLGGSSGRWVCMGVHTDGAAYGVRGGLYFSMPCVTLPGGTYEVISDLTVDDALRGALTRSEAELVEEAQHVGCEV